MPLPMFLGGIAKGIAGGAAKGAAKKFVSGKKGKKQEAKTETKSKTKDLGQKTSKKTNAKSTPKTKKVATVKLPKSVYKDAKKGAKPTADSNVSYDSLRKQLDNINRTASALGAQAELERQATKENLRQSRKDAKDKKADDKEKQLEKKKGKKGGGILSVGKKIGKNFGIFNFISNVALGVLAVWLLDNFDKVEKLFTQLTQTFQNPFRFIQTSIVAMSTVFAGPIRGGLSLLSKPLKFAGKQVVKLSNKVTPIMKKTFSKIGSGLVGLTKNTVGRITSAITGGAKGAASGAAQGTNAARKGQSVSKSLTKAGRQQGLFKQAKNLYGGTKNVAKKGAGRLLKIGGVFKKVPVIGGLLGLFIDLALGEPLDKAFVNAIGGGIGAWIGGAIGTGLIPIPILGSAIGGFLGYEIGKWGGNVLYDMIKKKMGLIPPIDPKDKSEPATTTTPPTQTGNQQTPNQSQRGQQTGTPSQQQAFNQIYNIAKKVGGAKFPEVVAAQAMHETGYLVNPNSVYFATGKTNPFGQTGDRGYGTIPRPGYANGWTLYPDLETAVKDHIKLWHDVKNNPGNYNAFNTPLEGIASVAPAYSPNADPANIAKGYTVDKYSKGMVRALNVGGFNPKGSAGQQSSKPVTQVSPMAGAGTQPVSQTTSQAQLAQQQSTTVTTQGTINDMYKGATNTSMFPTTSGYGMRKHPIYGDMRMHNGVDIAPPGPGYYVGLKVPGKVTLKSNDPNGYGNFVIITSQQTGMSYMFAHMATIDVNVGDDYTGQPIGEMGTTGGSTGIHLHYEVYQGGKGGPAVDPTPYMNLLTMGKVDGQVRSQTAQISSQQQSSSQASSVSSRTSYDPMSQNNGGGVVPVGVPGQSGGGGGGRSLNMGGPSTQQMLNSYYKSQLMGFLYKQG